MIHLLLICLILYVIVISYRREWCSPDFLFAILWTIVLGLYSMKLYGIYDVAYNTQRVLIMGITCFLAGCFLMRLLMRSTASSLSNASFLNDKPYIFNRLKVLSVLIILLAAPYFVPNILIGLRHRDFSVVKNLIMFDYLSHGGVLITFLVRPFGRILIALSAYCLIRHREQKLIITCGIIYICFELLGMWSKSILLTFLLFVFVAQLMNPDKQHLQLKEKMTRWGLVGLVTMGVALFFIFRVGHGLYFYICGCVPMLDKVLNNSFYLSDGYTYGFLSFNSAWRFLFHILSPLHIHNAYFDIAESYLFKFEATATIAFGKEYNAFHTLFGDFYIDFGLMGVVGLSLLFGMFSEYVYQKYRRQPSLYWHAMYCLIVFYIIYGVVRFQLSILAWGLPLIYACFLLKPLLYLKIKRS